MSELDWEALEAERDHWKTCAIAADAMARALERFVNSHRGECASRPNAGFCGPERLTPCIACEARKALKDWGAIKKASKR